MKGKRTRSSKFEFVSRSPAVLPDEEFAADEEVPISLDETPPPQLVDAQQQQVKASRASSTIGTAKLTKRRIAGRSVVIVDAYADLL
jgi:hypothetical protein